MSRYAQEFDRSLSDPEGFWGDAAKMIDWYQPPTQVLDRSQPAVLPVVRRRGAEHLLQRAGPARA